MIMLCNLGPPGSILLSQYVLCKSGYINGDSLVVGFIAGPSQCLARKGDRRVGDGTTNTLVIILLACVPAISCQDSDWLRAFLGGVCIL